MGAVTLSSNPIVVTSGDTFTATTDKVRIRAFYWETGGAAAAADTVKVTDGADKLLWESTLRADDLGDKHLVLPSKGLHANGLKVATPPTHGTLFIYLVDSV